MMNIETAVYLYTMQLWNWLVAYRWHKFTEVSLKLFFELPQVYRVSILWKREL